MSIARTRRIELTEYDPLWKDCFILLKMMSFRETIDLQKEVRASERSIYKADKAFRKLDDDSPDYEKLQDELDKVNAEHMGLLVKIIQRNLKGGKIHDGENLRDIIAEDIEDFDIELITEFIAVLSGQNSKKK